MAQPWMGKPLLYHYTGMSALKGILTTRNLWATDLRYLNDTAEYSYGVSMLSEELGLLLEERRLADPMCVDELAALKYMITESESGPIYVVCLTAAGGDQLSQWRGYSAGGGVALGFAAAELAAHAETLGFRLMTCIYKEAEQRAATRQYLDHCYQVMAGNRSRGRDRTVYGILGGGTFTKDFWPKFRELAPRLKAPGFGEEQEVRLVGWQETPPNIREGETVLVPYLTVGLGMDLGTQSPRYAIHALKSITIGPNSHPTRFVERSISAAFSSCGVHSVNVEVSSIPFRTGV
ncbi:MAG TPA: DUF2971 domain-containing protein [Steroidobacteraceae bacterium]|nr:DUF2971 domain-containing protein [Steroidobacteraceae bacterium]